MTSPPDKEFGQRLPRLSPDEPPAAAKKRSGQIGLLLMGMAAVGGSAYTLMPRENCDPNQPVLAIDQPADCRQNASSSSSSHGGGSSGGSSSRDSGHVTRGGFGSFMSHFSGGG
jgi:hypothetical protein